MTNLDFIRGVLEGIVDSYIDLSKYITEGDFTIYLEEGHVHRCWSCALDYDVDLDDPGMYMDAEDDENMIMEFLMNELVNFYRPKKKKK